MIDRLNIRSIIKKKFETFQNVKKFQSVQKWNFLLKFTNTRISCIASVKEQTRKIKNKNPSNHNVVQTITKREK